MNGVKWGLLRKGEETAVRSTVLARAVLDADEDKVVALCSQTDAELYYRLDKSGDCLGRALSHAYVLNRAVGTRLLLHLVRGGLMWPLRSSEATADVRGLNAVALPPVRRAVVAFLLRAPYELVGEMILNCPTRLPICFLHLVKETPSGWRGLDTRTLEAALFAEAAVGGGGAPRASYLDDDVLLRAMRVPTVWDYALATERSDRAKVLDQWEQAIQRVGALSLGIHCGFAARCSTLYRKAPRERSLLRRFLLIAKEVTRALSGSPEHAVFCSGDASTCNLKCINDASLVKHIAKTPLTALTVALCGLTVNIGIDVRAEWVMEGAYSHIFKPLTVAHPFRMQKVSRMHAALAEGAASLDFEPKTLCIVLAYASDVAARPLQPRALADVADYLATTAVAEVSPPPPPTRPRAAVTESSGAKRKRVFEGADAAATTVSPKPTATDAPCLEERPMKRLCLMLPDSTPTVDLMTDFDQTILTPDSSSASSDVSPVAVPVSPVLRSFAQLTSDIAALESPTY